MLLGPDHDQANEPTNAYGEVVAACVLTEAGSLVACVAIGAVVLLVCIDHTSEFVVTVC